MPHFFRNVRFWLFFILAAHALLALDAARQQSPAWDEIVYPAAGIDLWRHGRIRLNVDHPPLGKLLIALPLLPMKSRLAAWQEGENDFRFGFRFTHHSAVSARTLIFLPRLIAILCSLLLTLLLYLWARRWGSISGLTAATLYAFAPPVLARASLALLEIPVALFMMLALYGWAGYLETHRKKTLGICFLAVAAALLTKTTAFVVFPMMALVALTSSEKTQRLRYLFVLCGVGFGTIVLAESALQLLGSGFFSTQIFSRMGHYLTQNMSVYFHGEIYPRAQAWFGFAAMGLKTPPLLAVAALTGLFAGLRRHESSVAYRPLVAAILTYLPIMMAATALIATAHYFLLYPVLALLGGYAAYAINKEAGFRSRFAALPMTLTGLLCLGMLGEALFTHPNYGAYMTPLTGGVSHGYRWLWDSDQDWGQGLPGLATWMRHKKIDRVFLAYSGAGDPRIYGLRYVDVISPALVSAEYHGEPLLPGEIPQWLIVGSKVWQSETVALDWLRHRQPTAVIDGVWLAYDISDKETRAWLRMIYSETWRPRQAAALN